jgi:hypothetical protein
MIDPFVLLTPVLLLAVIALLRFVGCDLVFKLEPLPEASAPEISSISPESRDACGPQFTLTVTGTNLVDNPDPAKSSVVQWNGANLQTTYLPGPVLQADITADKIETKGIAIVTVFNPPPGLGQSTNAKVFTINLGAPKTVNFNPLPPGVNNNDPVNVFQNINFPGWIWFQDALNQGAIYFNDPMAITRTFTFVNGPRILQSMLVRHFDPAGASITITVTNDKGESAPPLSIQGGQFQSLNTLWVKCSQTVTVTLDTTTDNIGIVELTYLGPP